MIVEKNCVNFVGKQAIAFQLKIIQIKQFFVIKEETQSYVQDYKTRLYGTKRDLPTKLPHF